MSYFQILFVLWLMHGMEKLFPKSLKASDMLVDIYKQ